MAAEREAVGERARALEERLNDTVGGDHRPHRRVRRGDPLGRGDDVRLVAVALGAEPVTEPPPGADDLVGDQQHLVLVADLAHALEVAVGRREAAAGVLNRLEDHGGDRLGPLELDPRRDRLGQVLGAVAGREPVEVRVRDVAAARRERLERRAQAGHSGRAERAERRAVVCHFSRDHLRLVRVAGQLVELAGDLERLSTDSPPPEVKKTRLRSPGVSDAILAASSIARGWAKDQLVKKPSSRAWSAPACAMSARPWPMFVQNSELSASR